MPRAPKPCNKQGCPNLVYDDRRYCEIHYIPWRDKPFDKRRADTIAHQSLREDVLEAAHYRCTLRYPGVCIGVATEVDRMDNAGEYKMDNCQAVCTPCHRRKTSIEGHQARGHRI